MVYYSEEELKFKVSENKVICKVWPQRWIKKETGGHSSPSLKTLLLQWLQWWGKQETSV